MADDQTSSGRGKEHGRGTSGTRDATGTTEAEGLRAVQAYGTGVRTTLRNNATAYGFSVSITAAFGVVTSSHQQASYPLQAVLFAGGAVLAFLFVEAVAASLFRRGARGETENVVMISGAVDALSVLAAVGTASALSLVPSIAAWPLTAFGATFAYLLVGGVDVLVARKAAGYRSATG